MDPKTELVVKWFARARDDLHLGELALNSDPPVYWGAAFHAQQATEKLLKALLTFHDVEFEKVHDIDYLLELCIEAEPQADALRPTATKLTDFAVDSRYPLPRTDPTEPEAREALQIARRVLDFVAPKLRVHS